MSDLPRVEAHVSHLAYRHSVILYIHGIRQQELRAALRGVDLDGEHRGRSKQDPLGPGLGHEDRAFRQPVTAP